MGGIRFIQRAILPVLLVAFAALLPQAAAAATLYVSEFPNGLTQVGSTQPQIYPQSAIADQTVALSGSSAVSSAFNSKTKAVMLMCDEGCSVSFGGSSATATTSNYLLQQGVPYFFGVAPSTYVAAIANAAGNTGGGSTGPAQYTSPHVSTLTTSITRPNDSTPYTANDAFANSTSAPTTGGFTLTSACAASGGFGTITDAALSMSAGSTFQGEIYVFDQAVTATNDNSALSISDSDVLNYVGSIPFNTNDVNAANTTSYVTGLNIGYTCVGTANLRFLVKVTTAFTPAANEVLSVRVKVQN